MSDEELLERDLAFTAMDAAYLVDVMGLDNLLQAVLQYSRNPEQERAVIKALSALHSE